MILACPSCKARYLVPAIHFANGPRMVRCARCSHTWLAELPPEPGSFADQLSALAPPHMETPSTVRAIERLPIIHKKPRPFWLSNWVLALLIFILAAVLLYMVVERRELALRWPVLEPYYDRVGLHIYHAGEGLSLRQVHSEMRFEGGIMQLGVEGVIHNDTDKPQPIPDILAAAIGPDNKVMQSWQIDAPAAKVDPGENVPFISTIHAPQGTIVEVNLHFVEPENGSE